MRRSPFFLLAFSVLLIACSEDRVSANDDHQNSHLGSVADHLLGAEYAFIAWQAAECQRHWIDADTRVFELHTTPSAELIESARENVDRGREIGVYQARIIAAFAFARGERLRQAMNNCEMFDTQCRDPYFQADAHYWPQIERILYADMSGVRYNPERDQRCLAILESVRSIADTDFVRNNQPS
jgi:hypothetical protein